MILEGKYYNGKPAVIDISKAKFIYDDGETTTIHFGDSSTSSFAAPSYEAIKAAFISANG